MDRHSKLSGGTEQVALDSGTMISVKMPALVPGHVGEHLGEWYTATFFFVTRCT